MIVINMTSLLQITTLRVPESYSCSLQNIQPIKPTAYSTLDLIRNQHVQYEYPPLDETTAESSMGVGVGVEGETGAEVSVIMGGASSVFPPKF